jgi:hypothetical protein
MYRTSPTWYRDNLSEVLSVFSQLMSENKPKNLHLLPSFSFLDFESDGIHLNGISGLEHLLHLFDSSESLLDSLDLSPGARSVKDRESVRVLEDRVTVLEQDHRRLDRTVESRTAVEAELADFLANERMEDFVVISGLKRISSNLTSKEWQVQAVKDVQAVITSIMGEQFDGEVVVVQNATPRSKDAEVSYNVKMSSVPAARSIRRKFGSFFKGGEDNRPPGLKSISVANRVTPETKIRISILKLMASRYRDSNPGSRAQVIGYESRPLIKIIPPQGASDRRVRTFNYLEAVKFFPTHFTSAELGPILKRINPRLAGQLHALFIVLSDDDFRARPIPAATAIATDEASDQDSETASVQSGIKSSSSAIGKRNPKRRPEAEAGSSAKK